jgi:hypothetical protein
VTLLAPIWLIAGAAAALAVLALHFIARQRPAPMTLPTTRFIPDKPARAASRAPLPTDLLLLVVRALVVLLLGLAFAGPIVRPTRVPVVRIVMLDRSGAVAAPDSAAVRAEAMLRPGDVLVPFDTVATAVAWSEGDRVPAARQAPGDLAAALLVAQREARAAAARADSIEMVLISAIDAAAWSAAVLPVRAQWLGPIRVERIAGAAADTIARRPELRAEGDDPLAATVALASGSARAERVVRLVRDAPDAADTAWARDSAGVLVHWPAVVTASDTDAAAAPRRSGAVISGDVVAVAPWTRGAVPAGRPIAWWADGEPAAAENTLGSGCVREVVIGVPRAGDVALSAAAQRLVRALTGPCGAPDRLGPVADSLVAKLAGDGALVSGTRLVRAGVQTSRATPWLLAAGLALLLVEWMLRRRVRT